MRSKTIGFVITLAFILTGGTLFAQEITTAAAQPVVKAAPVSYPADIKLRGRMHFDAGYFMEDEAEYNDGFRVRRARLGATGKVADGWSFVLEYDFAENGVAANDVMLRGNVGPGTLKIGHFKVPMGLNELTSSNNITFLERASNSNTIVDSRKLGIGYDYFQGMFGVQTMIFGRGMGDEKEGDMPLGAAGRLVVAPLTGNMKLHLGVSAAYMDYKEYDEDNTAAAGKEYNTLRYRDRPEARDAAGTRSITATGNITDVDNTLKAGAELAFQMGPLSIEAEYLMLNISSFESDGVEPSFSGYHVQASYILTGESRGYRNGVFRGVTPKNSYGAVELAARYSSIDLTDEDLGGKQDNITLGLNYYVSSNVRFMANFIMSKQEDAAGNEDSPNIFITRAQYNF